MHDLASFATNIRNVGFPLSMYASKAWERIAGLSAAVSDLFFFIVFLSDALNRKLKKASNERSARPHTIFRCFVHSFRLFASVLLLLKSKTRKRHTKKHRFCGFYFVLCFSLKTIKNYLLFIVFFIFRSFK